MLIQGIAAVSGRFPVSQDQPFEVGAVGEKVRPHMAVKFPKAQETGDPAGFEKPPNLYFDLIDHKKNLSSLKALQAKPAHAPFMLNHASILSGEGPRALICSLNSLVTRTKVGASAEESHSTLSLPGSIPAKAISFLRTATLLDAE
jgi:hypothetical protein